MNLDIDTAKLGNFAKRLATQAAISATVMTGLHMASGSDLSPASWLYGPEDGAASAPSGMTERGAAAEPDRPAFRFAGIPAADAEPPAAEVPAARSAASGKPQKDPSTAKTVVPGIFGCRPDCPPVIPARLAVPTPRPEHAKPRYVRPDQADMEASMAPRRVAFLAPTTATIAPPTGTVPELVGDEPIPHPPEVADVPERRSIIAGILPAAPMVLKEAGFLARAAGGTVSGIAERTVWRLLP